MFAYGGTTALWFAALLLSALPAIRPQDGADIGTFCIADGDRTRFAVIREDIIAKLNLFLSFNITSESSSLDSVQNASREIDPALLTAYGAASRVLEEEEPGPTGCAKDDRGRGTPFAKRISLFFPADSAVVYMPPNMLDKKEHDIDEAKEDSNASNLPFRYTFVFNLTLPSQKEVIYSAELRLFKKTMSSCKEMPFENVKVFYVLIKDGKEQERLLVTSRSVETCEDEYDSFNITAAVNKWKENGVNESLELEVIVNCPFSTTSGLFSPPSIEFVSENKSSSPPSERRAQLVVATITEEVAAELEQKRRKRRQAVDSGYCSNNSNAAHCCIRNLEVNFHTDLNLTWVIYPLTFTPNYCRGFCPIPFLGDGFLRMSIQQFYETSEIAGAPCCTIYSMDPLLMIFQDPRNDEIIMADVPDMEIKSCGCVD